MPKLNETVGLVSEVISDTKTLFELQLKLLQAQVEELATVTKQLVFLGAIALAALIPATFFLGLTLSDVLVHFTSLPTWACNLIVSVMLLGTGSIPVLKAMALVKEKQGGK